MYGDVGSEKKATSPLCSFMRPVTQTYAQLSGFLDYEIFIPIVDGGAHVETFHPPLRRSRLLCRPMP